MFIGLPEAGITAPQILAAGVVCGVYNSAVSIVPIEKTAKGDVRIGVSEYRPLFTYGGYGGERSHQVEELHPRYQIDPRVYGTFGRVWADYGAAFSKNVACDKQIDPELLALRLDQNFAVEIDLIERRNRDIPFLRAETGELTLKKHFLDPITDWNSITDRIEYAAAKFLVWHVKIAAMGFEGDPELAEKLKRQLAA